MKTIAILASVIILTGCINRQAIMRTEDNKVLVCNATAYGLIPAAMEESKYDRCKAEAERLGYKLHKEIKEDY